MNHQISIIVGLSCTCNTDHWHSTWKGCNSCSTCICIQVYLLNCMSSTLGKQRFTSWSLITGPTVFSNEGSSFWQESLRLFYINSFILLLAILLDLRMTTCPLQFSFILISPTFPVCFTVSPDVLK